MAAPSFQRILELLERHRVAYAVVGGVAAVLQGAPITTFDLDALVKRYGPLPPARAVWILKQACRSLADAHARGLVHRDLKPQNVFLQFDSNGQLPKQPDVKLLDFGLARAFEGDATQYVDFVAVPGAAVRRSR